MKTCATIFYRLLAIIIILGSNLAWGQPNPVRTKPLNGILLSSPGLPRGIQVNVRIFLEIDETWMPPNIAEQVADLYTDNDARFNTQLPIYSNSRLHTFKIIYTNCSGSSTEIRLFANPSANSFLVYPYYCFNIQPPCTAEFFAQLDTLTNPTGTVVSLIPNRQRSELDSCFGANRTMRWTVDNEVVDTSSHILVKLFQNPGPKRVCLNITNRNTGQTHQFCRTIFIPNRCNFPLRLTHNVVDSVHHFAVNGLPSRVEVVWDLGDGTYKEGTNIEHFYRFPGRYIVCAVAKFSGFCMVSGCDTVNIVPRPGHFEISVVVQGSTPEFSQGNCAADSVMLEVFGYSRGDRQTVTVQQNPNRNCRFNLSLPNGNYLLKASPVGPSQLRYAPTYSFSSLDWQHADVVNSPGNRVINLIPKSFNPVATDSGMVRGFVLGLGNMVNYRNPETNQQQQIVFDPENARLILGDSVNTMLDVQPLNLDGIFEINHLPIGKYWLSLDHPMVEPASVQFSINRWGFSPLIQYSVEEQGLKVISTLNSRNQTQIKIYPNPAHDWLTIQTPVALEQVTLTDLTGRKLLHTKAEKLNLGVLKSGCYMLIIKTADGQYFTTKVSKK